MVSTLEVAPSLTRLSRTTASLRSPPSNLPLEGLLHALEASWQRGGPGWERRTAHRYDFCQTVTLVPLTARTEEPEGSCMIVETQELSANGVGISHSQPLPYKKVALTLALPCGARVTVITKLLWCRFTKEGRYASGGQFLRWVELPDE